MPTVPGFFSQSWGVANVHVWKVGLSGRPKAADLMPKFDRMAYDQSISDTGDVGEVSSLAWSADGKRVFFLSSDTGVTNLFSVPSKGGRPTRIFDGKCHIKGYSVNGKTRLAALIHADLSNAGEIVVCQTSAGAVAGIGVRAVGYGLVTAGGARGQIRMGADAH